MDEAEAALVDCTRDELRERIALALARFDRLARSADPLARPPGSQWTVQQAIAHVLTIAQRYVRFRRGTYRLADRPSEVSLLNQCELEAAMAPVTELADQLQAIAPELNALFDEVAEQGRALPFHCGVLVDGTTWQTNWLGELLIHGYDIARAVKVPWETAEFDMLVIARGLMQIGPAYVKPGRRSQADTAVAVELPGARPYLIHIHQGTGDLRVRRADDRLDAVLRMPASIFALLLYQRIGALGATRRGLRLVGGRRPWVALKLQSLFEAA